jgi:hypothetical protein
MSQGGVALTFSSDALPELAGVLFLCFVRLEVADVNVAMSSQPLAIVLDMGYLQTTFFWF